MMLQQVPELRLKPLSDTRWLSRIDAIKPLNFHLIQIHVSVLETAEIDSFNIETRHKASSTLSSVQIFKFIWYDVL